MLWKTDLLSLSPGDGSMDAQVGRVHGRVHRWMLLTMTGSWLWPRAMTEGEPPSLWTQRAALAQKKAQAASEDADRKSAFR
jgi:hypothetical protein